MNIARRHHLARIGLTLALAHLALAPGRAAEFNVPSQQYPTLQEAIDAAATADDEPHFIHLRQARLDLASPVSIGADFSETKPLTIRPDPAVASLRRVTLAAHFGNEPILIMTGSAHVIVQDLDLIRHTTNQEDLVRLRNCEDVVLERCRVGSDWNSVGARNRRNLVIADPRHVVVRNCLFFSYLPGNFEQAISVSMISGLGHSVVLDNNVASDHRTYGIEIAAAGDAVSVLRNNVVANHPGLTPAPTAFHSALDELTVVVSSHNTAFASDGHLEQQDGPQGIAGALALLQFDMDQVGDAFLETKWRTDQPWHPNPRFFRLRHNGILHQNQNDAGLTLEADNLPDPHDEPVVDDIEKDVRPSGDPSRTDRGADQFRSIAAGDAHVTLPRTPPVRGVSLNGRFQVIAVGPQEDIPVVLMSGGRIRLGGGFTSILSSLPLAASVQFDPTAGILRLTWPITATPAVLESATAVGAAANWTPVNATPENLGSVYRVSLPTTGPALFFRLRE